MPVLVTVHCDWIQIGHDMLEVYSKTSPISSTTVPPVTANYTWFTPREEAKGSICLFATRSPSWEILTASEAVSACPERVDWKDALRSRLKRRVQHTASEDRCGAVGRVRNLFIYNWHIYFWMFRKKKKFELEIIDWTWIIISRYEDCFSCNFHSALS